MTVADDEDQKPNNIEKDETLLQEAQEQDVSYLAQQAEQQPANAFGFSWDACYVGYQSWYSKNAAWSALSFNAVLSVVSLNAVLCFLVINGFGSILSINSAFSIASANCAFCIVSNVLLLNE